MRVEADGGAGRECSRRPVERWDLKKGRKERFRQKEKKKEGFERRKSDREKRGCV
jgi:hypothetical protein